MASCPKCHNQITCGCQYVKSNNKIVGCSKCVKKNKQGKVMTDLMQTLTNFDL